MSRNASTYRRKEASYGALSLRALHASGIIVANAAGRLPFMAPRFRDHLRDLDIPAHTGRKLGPHVHQVDIPGTDPQVALLHMLHRLQTEAGHQHLARLLLRSDANGRDAVANDGENQHHDLHRVDPVGEEGPMVGAVVQVIDREVLDAPQRRASRVLQYAVEQLGCYPVAPIARRGGGVRSAHRRLHLAGNGAAERYVAGTGLMRGLVSSAGQVDITAGVTAVIQGGRSPAILLAFRHVDTDPHAHVAATGGRITSAGTRFHRRGSLPATADLGALVV